MMFSIDVLAPSLLAYIGPGGGIALLGPLLGVVLAAVAALLMVVLWPIRMMLKKGRSVRGGDQVAAVTGTPAETGESLS